MSSISLILELLKKLLLLSFTSKGLTVFDKSASPPQSLFYSIQIDIYKYKILTFSQQPIFL